MSDQKPNTHREPDGCADCSVAHGSAPSIDAGLLPPPEIIDAAEKVRVWMESNGYRERWVLGGVCSRDHVGRARRWQKRAEDIAKERGELFRAGENMAAELCQWCPHEHRGEVLLAWDAAAEPIREMKRELSLPNAEFCGPSTAADTQTKQQSGSQ